jgi:hypothetical protein
MTNTRAALRECTDQGCAARVQRAQHRAFRVCGGASASSGREPRPRACRTLWIEGDAVQRLNVWSYLITKHFAATGRWRHLRYKGIRRNRNPVVDKSFGVLKLHADVVLPIVIDGSLGNSEAALSAASVMRAPWTSKPYSHPDDRTKTWVAQPLRLRKQGPLR